MRETQIYGEGQEEKMIGFIYLHFFFKCFHGKKNRSISHYLKNPPYSPASLFKLMNHQTKSFCYDPIVMITDAL